MQSEKLLAFALACSLLGALAGCGVPQEEEGDEAGECSDAADNDVDGLFDCDDEGCANAPACAGDDDDSAGDDDDSAGDDDDDAGDDDAGDDDDSAGEGITMIVLAGGTFDMGCTAGQSDCEFDESPVHSVTLTNNFWMSETEVTQGQWQALMGNNPSDFSSCGANCPVENVNWWATLVFANAMSSAEGLAQCYSLSGCTNGPTNAMECSSVSLNSGSGSVYDCEGYRLPTEAEWEYAARAGTDLLYAGGNTMADVGWYWDNSDSTTHAVATKDPNAGGCTT